MNQSNPSDLEARIQAAAERGAAVPELPSDDVEAYRQVYRAIRVAPLPAPPALFARSMERLTRDHEEQAAPEIWITRLVVVAVSCSIAAAVPAFGGIIAAVTSAASALPWSTALAASLALACAMAIDRLAGSGPGSAKPGP